MQRLLFITLIFICAFSSLLLAQNRKLNPNIAKYAPEFDPRLLPAESPMFIMPGNSPVEICIYNDTCVFIQIVDPDNDQLTVTVDGPARLQTDLDQPGFWVGYCCIEPFELCGETEITPVTVIADDGETSDTLILDVYFVGKLTATVGANTHIVPGDTGTIPLYLDSYESCFCLGGFILSMMYNGQMMTIDTVYQGSLIENGAYFNVVYNNDDPFRSTIKVIFINSLTGYAPPICDIPSDSPMVYIDVTLSPFYEYAEDNYLPISFKHINPMLHSVTDSTGDISWLVDGCDSTGEENAVNYLELMPPSAWITGVVTDDTLNPLAATIVTIRGDTDLLDTTFIDGKYIVELPYLDSYDLIFAHDEYSTEIFRDVVVQLGDTLEVDVILHDYLRYLPGDCNMMAGLWPPSVVGNDITYLVNYFRGLIPACLLHGFYCAADFNGDCSINGSDVTYAVNYFRGFNQIHYCPNYEPEWATPGEIPSEMPESWPNCE